jgi:hypothetical protein
MSGVLHSSDCNVYLLGTSTDPWVQRITALNRLEAITSMKRSRARFATLGTKTWTFLYGTRLPGPVIPSLQNHH